VIQQPGAGQLRLDGNYLSGPAPAALANLSALEENASRFCGSQLYTDDAVLSAFLDSVQIGGDWRGCQAAQIPPRFWVHGGHGASPQRIAL